MGGRFSEAAQQLVEVGRSFHSRGWALGTSGNFSTVVSRNPFRLAITASGIDKGRLKARQVLLVNAQGDSGRGPLRPSDETKLHLAIARTREAGSVLHTHSIWSTMLSETMAAVGGLRLEGFEMLKGLSGVHTHQHQEWLPIIENSQDMAALSRSFEQVLGRYPGSHGVLLRAHGLYTWGRDLAEARRHVEILEFLLEVVGRMNSHASLEARPSRH